MQSVKFYGATDKIVNQIGNLEVVSNNKETDEICFRVINKNNKRNCLNKKTKMNQKTLKEKIQAVLDKTSLDEKAHRALSFIYRETIGATIHERIGWFIVGFVAASVLFIIL